MRFLLEPKRAIATIIIASLLSFAGTCEQKASTVISYVNKAIPLLTASGVDISDAQDVIRLMNEFQTNPTAATLSAVTLAFDKTVAKAQTISNQGKRTAVIVILVAANIALTSLAEKLLNKAAENPTDARLGAPATRMQIRRFANKPKWQCKATARVENYKAGDLMPMEMCKKYPDSGVVETQ